MLCRWKSFLNQRCYKKPLSGPKGPTTDDVWGHQVDPAETITLFLRTNLKANATPTRSKVPVLCSQMGAGQPGREGALASPGKPLCWHLSGPWHRYPARPSLQGISRRNSWKHSSSKCIHLQKGKKRNTLLTLTASGW